MLNSRDYFRAESTAIYDGMFHPTNHVELFLSVLRPNCETFSHNRYCPQGFDQPALFQKTQSRLTSFASEASAERILLSTEGLSLLRQVDEIERLKQILPCPPGQTKVLIYRRSPEGFLRSYRAQLGKVAGRTASSDPRSALYVQDDTWLLQFDKVISLYQTHFPGTTLVLDYDEELRTSGCVIPGFMRWLGITLPADYNPGEYRLNASPGCDGRDRESNVSWFFGSILRRNLGGPKLP
jgi:hypothetical protein